MADDVLRADVPVVLRAGGGEGRLWGALLDVAAAQPSGWTLVGGLMVMLHALEVGLATGRVTNDVDAVAESRGVAQATHLLSSTLVSLGWSLDARDFTGEETGFTFRRDGLRFDVLAAEGLGPRADITTLPPAQSVPVAGGTRALQRSQRVAVRLGDRGGVVPRPDVLGALVIKSAAAALDRGRSSDPTRRPERHAEDLAVLYTAVADPVALRAELTGGDLRRLRAAPEPTWEVVRSAASRAAGIAAYAVIVA